MLFCLCFEVMHIYIPIIMSFYHYHFIAHHYCACRVSAVCRYGYKDHIAVAFFTAFVVAAYCQQAGIFALCTTVRLQATSIKSSDLA